MHASALNQIVEYLAVFEGGGKSNPITWMYLDERGLVSTGVGILFDPLADNKYKVTFYKKNDAGAAGDTRASDAELKSEWDMVKGKAEPVPDKAGELRPKSGFGSYKAFEAITQLRIKEAALSGSALTMVTGIDRSIKHDFGPDYDTWPADVQVAIVQMAYAGGLDARKREGKLYPLLKARDWFNAQDYTYLSNPKSGRAGYATYNRALPTLMMNGWIIDQVRAIEKMNTPAPKDHTRFYGLKSRLWVARWNVDVMDAKVTADDLITGGDVTGWVKAAR